MILNIEVLNDQILGTEQYEILFFKCKWNEGKFKIKLLKQKI